MAIVTNRSGKFYDVDDNVLEKSELKGDDLAKKVAPGTGAPPPGVNPAEEAEGRHHHHHWHNHWRNCC